MIAESIDSVEQLEILLLLRSEPEKAWSAEEIDSRIKSSLSSIRSRLAGLEKYGLVHRSDDRHRYDPAPEVQIAVDELAVAYDESRYTVIDLIFAKPDDKLSLFARAFRLRGSDDG